MKTQVKFKEWKCELQFAEYGNKRKAIMLVDENDDLIATATVNLPTEHCFNDEVFIKDYSENDGMLLTLVMAGIISHPIAWVKSGWVTIPKCKLLKTE